ncbi:hypothetical protein MTR67_023330 [Solanum verrucosum]|uniref:Uncharacterized protein n=1 Tax=Solanum verrucosum TaxID=315347 RepID=A0AAF0QW97_SOLVR|nr:hypothetical protein MTR67_023330 [Solanum verrucosum]
MSQRCQVVEVVQRRGELQGKSIRRFSPKLPKMKRESRLEQGAR